MVVSNIFYFHPYFLEMIQFDEYIFQMGRNHQLGLVFFLPFPFHLGTQLRKHPWIITKWGCFRHHPWHFQTTSLSKQRWWKCPSPAIRWIITWSLKVPRSIATLWNHDRFGKPKNGWRVWQSIASVRWPLKQGVFRGGSGVRLRSESAWVFFN